MSSLTLSLAPAKTTDIFTKARKKDTVKRIKNFFARYNGIRLKIRGKDLLALGVRPGPHFKKFLEKVLCEKLDGHLRTKRDEFKFLKKVIKIKK